MTLDSENALEEQLGKSAKGTQTLLRGLDLVERVLREPMRIAELARRSGLSPATTGRLVGGLVNRGFLAVAPTGQLRAGPKLIQLGSAARSRHDLLGTAAPHLKKLSEKTGLCSFLGRRDGDYSMHLHRNQGSQRVIVATPVGTRRPLAETSLGKALLLDDSAESWRRHLANADSSHVGINWEVAMRENVARGVVIHRGPPPDSIRAVAAPVRDASGRILGAISVATVSQYVDTEQLDALAPLVLETARDIGRALGYEHPLPS
jgi:DNA-binding IclR family transcriptional regulator